MILLIISNCVIHGTRSAGFWALTINYVVNLDKSGLNNVEHREITTQEAERIFWADGGIKLWDYGEGVTHQNLLPVSETLWLVELLSVPLQKENMAPLPASQSLRAAEVWYGQDVRVGLWMERRCKAVHGQIGRSWYRRGRNGRNLSFASLVTESPLSWQVPYLTV